MCGRKTLTKNIASIIEELIIDKWNYPDFIPSYNIAPSQFSPVVIGENHSRIVKKMRWGFVESDWERNKISTPIINARAETILEKPLFKNLVHSNRCIIVSDGYFEWDKDSKKPHYIYHPQKKILPMAGLWKSFSRSSNTPITAYTVITTSAQDNISQIHHRMPAILQKKHMNKWIFSNENNISDMKKYLKPYEKKLKSYPVSSIVNSTSNNSTDCIKQNHEYQTLLKF
tara:strand:- start:624 stop:1310 length:687 start_codon:yes stop_codon:yes gene_type:complete